MTQINILVLFYSRNGATKQLAEFIAEGVESVPGANAILRTVPNITSVTQALEDTIPPSGPPYAEYEDLKHCDGLAMGSPTRFGNMAAPMKYFLDGSVNQWLSGALIDKPACVFTSTGSMHGGQESTLLSMMIPLLHHGMLMCGLPYSNPELSSSTSGGTPYGVSHLAGSDGQYPLSSEEKKLAQAQGARLARLAIALKDAR